MAAANDKQRWEKERIEAEAKALALRNAGQMRQEALKLRQQVETASRETPPQAQAALGMGLATEAMGECLPGARPARYF